MSKHEEPVSEEQQSTEVPETEQTLSPEEELKAQLAELNDKHIRLYSEFDNYRKRSMKERVELIKTASESVILSLLPVLDDFDRAIKAMETADGSHKEGIELIYSKLFGALERQGVKVMPSIGETFDPELQEAVAQLPVDDASKKNIVIDEVQKGYYLHDKVIRHAKVVVGI